MLLASTSYGLQHTHTAPLIILHGLFGSSQNWTSLSKRFALTRPVHALDLRNHGSSFHHDEHSASSMMKDVVEYAKHNFGDREFHLLAHSMGGKVAMSLALSQRERLSKMIVLDMSPKPYPLSQTMKNYIVSMLEIQALRLTNAKDADTYLKQTIPESSIRAFLMTNLKRVDGVFQFRINLQSLLNNYDRLGEWDHPIGSTSPVETLFLAGKKSDYISGAEESQLVFPNSTLKWVDAGHWLHAEKPEEVISLVEEFLK